MINVAVIGVGNMGKNHARVYSELPNVKLVAICDINENTGKAIASKYRCKFYKNYREMLKKEKIDAVSIALPTSLHKIVTLDVINMGKHVLLEKPIANSIEDGKEIIRAAKEKNIKLMIGHVERFNPVVIKLKELLDNKKFGNIKTIVIKRVGLFPPQIKDTNVVIDLAIHDIDICNYLLNKKPTLIYASAGKTQTNIEDYANIFLKYEDIDVFIQVNWITPIKIRNLCITGTKGYAEINYITQELKFYENQIKKSYETFKEFVNMSQPKGIFIPVEKKEPLKGELESFISFILSGICPIRPEDALDAVDLANKVIQSYKENRIILNKI